MRCHPSLLAAVLAWTALATGCSSSTEPLQPQELRLEALTATSLTGIVGLNVSSVPAVRVVGTAGRPVAGIEITFLVSGGGTAGNQTVVTDHAGYASAGSWRLGTVAGDQHLTARGGGAPDVVFTALASPSHAARVIPVAGNLQTATAGSILPHPLRARVTDAYDNVIAGHPVQFSVVSGSGSLGGASATSDETGIASSGAWKLGPAPGHHHVRVTAGSSEATFTAVACPHSCQEAQILFVRDGLIHRTSIAGNDEAVLYGLGAGSSPAWSPDGSRIAFARFDVQAQRTATYIMNADGSGLVHLADDFHSPSWSPDGNTLVAALGACRYDCSLWMLSARDGNAQPAHFAAMAAHPAWSPDGNTIAFVSLSGDDGYHELRVMKTDGTGMVAVTQRDPGFISRPAWSPDGQLIAFSKCIAQGCDVHVAHADGSVVTRITSTGRAIDPAWSPDGVWIAFTDLGTGDDPAVAFLPAVGGSQPVPLTSSGYHAAWRPTAQAHRR